MDDWMCHLLSQLLLPIFLLMILVGMAGGKPEAVLKFVVSIAGKLVSGFLDLVVALAGKSSSPSRRPGNDYPKRPRGPRSPSPKR
jgi:hypothetical protein